MALIDLGRKEIHCKIVYYGPGRGGKTTNLLYIYNALDINTRGKMLTIETKGDKTLFFDLLPLNLGKINEFDIKFQLYTVPGQQIYKATRKLVLRGVDGIVFVADSLNVRQAQNIESFNDMCSNLIDHNLSIEKLPVILQYNKRDLSQTPIPTLSIEQLEADLNTVLKIKSFESSAIKGIGVFETLREICKMTVRHVTGKHFAT